MYISYSILSEKCDRKRYIGVNGSIIFKWISYRPTVKPVTLATSVYQQPDLVGGIFTHDQPFLTNLYLVYLLAFKAMVLYIFTLGKY
jgi:hypothetical protein